MYFHYDIGLLVINFNYKNKIYGQENCRDYTVRYIEGKYSLFFKQKRFTTRASPQNMYIKKINYKRWGGHPT
jgi:hypothetical protein